MTYKIVSVPKPRMTQRDKWAKRPAVVRYRAFCDEVRALGVNVKESGSEVVFVIPMPKSWSKKKKAEMIDEPHQQRPDLDNLLKALLDAIYDEDCTVWNIKASKIWGETGPIEIL